MLLKALQVFIMLKFLILLIPNYNLKVLILQLKKLKKVLTELRGLKFVTSLVLAFTKIESDDNTNYNTFYSGSNADIIINESDIVFDSIYNKVILNKINL